MKENGVLNTNSAKAGVLILGIAVLYFGFLSSAVPLWSRTAPEPSAVTQTPAPPTPLGLTGNGTTDLGRSYKDGEYFSEILIRPIEKRLTFWWRMNSDYQLGDDALSYIERETVWFWPQTAEWVSETELLVAGLSPRDGASVLQVWTYENDPTKPYITTLVDAIIGQATYRWHVPLRLSVQQVWNDPNLSKVIWTKENPGTQGHVFVLVEGGDVFDLELSTGQYSLVASPVAGAPLVVPDLASTALIGGWGMEHVSDGYVYAICSSLENLGTAEYVYLIDDDKDGVLDTWATVLTLQDPNRYNSDAGAISTW